MAWRGEKEQLGLLLYQQAHFQYLCYTCGVFLYFIMTSEERFAKRLIERSRKVVRSIFADRKEKLFAGMRGMVLEIGPGAGVNLGYYPKEIRWVGVEINQFLFPYLLERAAQAGLKEFRIEKGTAEELPAVDASIDAVVSTQVLCSVGDVSRALTEVRRVLKPGGTFYFFEHVAAPRGTWMRVWQDRMNFYRKWRARGCNMNREILDSIQAAGFKAVSVDTFPVGRILPEPYISGTAIK
jgi:ubiquinone/menaquinone biosynthesis C-methylase UbiE